MKNLIRTAALAGLSLAMAASLLSAPATAKPVKLPAFERKVMPNGLVVLVMPDHRLPVVELELLVRAGSDADPIGKEGLSSLSATLLRRGTTTRSARDLAEGAEFLGSTLETSSDRDYTEISMETLQRNLEPSMALLAEALLHPALTDSEFARAREEAKGQLDQYKDDAGIMAGIHFFEDLFGSSPYAHTAVGNRAALDAMTAADVREFHHREYLPAQSILAVVGDVDPAQAEALVQKYLSAWQGGPATPRPSATGRDFEGGRILLYDKPDATQTEFRLGCQALPRSHPDWYPMEVAQAILGGGFTSRITAEIRTRRGLSYSPSSHVFYFKNAGIAYLDISTKNSTTLETIRLAEAIVKDMRDQPIGADELKKGQNFVLGTFLIGLQRPEALADLMARAELFGLDPRWADGMDAKIRAVTAADVQRVVRTYFCEKPLLVMVGRRSEIQAQVDSLGKVEIRKL